MARIEYARRHRKLNRKLENVLEFLKEIVRVGEGASSSSFYDFEFETENASKC